MRTRSHIIAPIALLSLFAVGLLALSHDLSTDPGDLIQVLSNSVRIGFLLDEFPSDSRPAVAANVLAKSDAWWSTRVEKQLKLTQYKTIFLSGFYKNMNSLVIPFDAAAHTISFQNSASRSNVNGRDMIWRHYTLLTYIVGKTGTAVQSASALGSIGGTASVQVQLPTDPYLLFQRAGYACADEDQYPHNSLDDEGPENFYDDSCTAGPAVNASVECTFAVTGCHCTEGSTYSCNQALNLFTGGTTLTFTYTRLAWNEQIATRMESANTYNLNPDAVGADLQGYVPGLEHNWIAYRYFAAGSCESLECIDGIGWRKLLVFDSIHINVGSTDLFMASLDYVAHDEATFNETQFHHMYYWDPCHQHPHFSQYAKYLYGSTTVGHKQGFCIETTNRIINSRNTAIPAPYPSCTVQGIGVGWADNYNGGIPCQWIDITSIDTSAGAVVRNLEMIGNPSDWMCEGITQYNSDGTPMWEYTGTNTTHPPWPVGGLPIDVYRCNTSPGALLNNDDQVPVADPKPGNGLVTSPCPDGDQIFGPKRDCELTILNNYLSCSHPGQQVSMTCTASGSYSQVLRVCEASVNLQSGTACRFNDNWTLSNTILPPGMPIAVTFTCPSARDSIEIGGHYALYSGALYNQQTPNAAVTCTVAQ